MEKYGSLPVSRTPAPAKKATRCMVFHRFLTPIGRTSVSMSARIHNAGAC